MLRVCRVAGAQVSLVKLEKGTENRCYCHVRTVLSRFPEVPPVQDVPGSGLADPDIASGRYLWRRRTFKLVSSYVDSNGFTITLQPGTLVVVRVRRHEPR